jgi:hypothetical protein
MTDALLPCDYDESGACQTHPGGAASWCDKAPSPKLDLPQEVREAMERTKSVDEGGCPCEDCDDNRTFAAFILRIAGEGCRG